MRRWKRLAALAPLLFTAAASAPSPTLEFEIVSNGVVNGELSATFQGAHKVVLKNHYQSQDKVRDLTVDVTLDAEGLPIAMRRVGEAFAYQKIDEEFAVTGQRARWRNVVEAGSFNGALGRYYIPLGLTNGGDSAAYEVGLLAAALLRAPQNRLPLLPVGEAQARVLTRLTVSESGRSEALRLVAISGLGMEPEYVWLDAENRLFAGRNTIRKGWRESAGRLALATAEADAASLSAAVAPLRAGTPPKAILIHDVAVFDARQGRILPHRSVLIEAGRIAAVEPARGDRSPPQGAQVIDGRGLTLLPGLWDMHVHLKPREALRHLASGVTTVRDLGNDNAALARLDARIRGGDLPGPRVIRAGFIEGLGPITTYNGRLVASQAEALAAVDAYADAGFSQIKLYNAVRPEWVKAIAKRTHERGLRLSGHIPMGGRTEQAVADGYDEIQHFVFLLLGLDEAPIASPLTFNAARAVRDVDLSEPKTAALIRMLREEEVAADMTLTVYEGLFRGKPGVPAPVFSRYAEHLPAAMLRQVSPGPLPTPPDLTDETYQQGYAKALTLTRMLRRGGVQLVAGTDFAPLSGLAFPRELELMVEAGLTPAESLRIATLEAAQVMKMDKTLGTVEAGKLADLILVAGDPTQRIEQVRELQLVIKDGVPYQPAALLTASGLE